MSGYSHAATDACFSETYLSFAFDIENQISLSKSSRSIFIEINNLPA